MNNKIRFCQLKRINIKLFQWLFLIAVSITISATNCKAMPSTDTLIVAISAIPPMVVTEDGKISGFEIDLWEAIAGRLDLSYRYVELPFDVIFDSLQTDFTDIALAGITINATRETIIDFSHPFIESGLGIMVRADYSAGLSDKLKDSFSPGIRRGLLYLVLFIILCGHIMWWSEKGKDAINDHYFPGIFEAFWLVTTTMTTVGYGDIAPRQWFGRIAAFLVMMTGIGLFGWLIGEFSAVTTVSKFHHSIESTADLRGKKVATVKATTSVSALEKFGAKVTETVDFQSACDLLSAGSVQAVVYDSPALRYYIKASNSDTFTMSGEDFNQQYYGFAFPQGSSLREVVNRELLTLRESQQQIVDYNSISLRWFGSD